jgi:hypothetical protein
MNDSAQKVEITAWESWLTKLANEEREREERSARQRERQLTAFPPRRGWRARACTYLGKALVATGTWLEGSANYRLSPQLTDNEPGAAC